MAAGAHSYILKKYFIEELIPAIKKIFNIENCGHPLAGVKRY
jgi:hypothetical protein